VVESPPAIVCGIRAYTQTENGLKTLTEAWMRKPPEDLNRVLTLPEDFDTGAGLMKIEKALNQVSELRGILCTQPRLASVPKKKPDVMEVKVDGGTTRDRFGYLKSILGKEVRASDIFKEGQFVDVIAVTKGKGVQGPVKRWGVKTLHHKSRKTVRGVGTLGPWRPGYVMYTVPRAGQMGFHQRTEYNKRILKIGSDGEGATPKGGFTRYGVVKSDYIMLRGSVPGPMKRLIKIRYPARPPSMVPEKTPSITYTSFAA
ncbi:MAG: 50S ribosomal protein L3, partial [Candidatus Bathyarchaeia archaeon]